MKTPPRLGATAWSWLVMAGLFAVTASAQLPPLTPDSGSPRLPGKFVWCDLVTDDVPAARKFYSQLFGWTFRDLGDYTIAANDERPLCGLLQRPKPAKASAKPRWIGYVSVNNVKRAEQAVTRAGGKVLAPPQQLPERGEQAVFADPDGAVFGVVKSSAGDPGDFLPDPGDWIWVQLHCPNAERAATFYKSLAGYEVVPNSSDNRASDYVLTSKGYARATIRAIPGNQVKPNWLPFVRVQSVAASVAKAKQLGGTALIEPRPTLLQGKAAVIADPTGAAIGLLEWSDELLKGAQ